MHQVHSALPSPELRGYVRAYAQREVNSRDPYAEQPVTPFLEPVLHFEFNDPITIRFKDGRIQSAFRANFVGIRTSYGADLCFAGSIECFAVFFHPFAVWRLFGTPSSGLVDTSLDGHDVLGREIRELWDKLAESSCFAARVAVMETYLKRRAATAAGLSPILRGAAHLFAQRGMLPIRALAADSALSVRQVERGFLREVGLGPKLFARIARYQTALDAKVVAPQRSWLDIAHALGYHDQAHMIRDFHLLSGTSPERTIESLGDNRPSLLAGTSQTDTSPAKRTVTEQFHETAA